MKVLNASECVLKRSNTTLSRDQTEIWKKWGRIVKGLFSCSSREPQCSTAMNWSFTTAFSITYMEIAHWTSSFQWYAPTFTFFNTPFMDLSRYQFFCTEHETYNCSNFKNLKHRSKAIDQSLPFRLNCGTLIRWCRLWLSKKEASLNSLFSFLNPVKKNTRKTFVSWPQISIIFSRTALQDHLNRRKWIPRP